MAQAVIDWLRESRIPNLESRLSNLEPRTLNLDSRIGSVARVARCVSALHALCVCFTLVACEAVGNMTQESQ